MSRTLVLFDCPEDFTEDNIRDIFRNSSSKYLLGQLAYELKESYKWSSRREQVMKASVKTSQEKEFV